MRRILVVILLVLAGFAPARADIVIEGSPGRRGDIVPQVF